MYSNVFFKTLRDGRRSMLLFAFAQFVFGIYLALLFLMSHRVLHRWLKICLSSSRRS